MKEAFELIRKRIEEIWVDNRCGDCVYKSVCDKVQEEAIANDQTDLCGVTIKSVALSIVSEVEAEYGKKGCALCYLGSPCEYQNEDVRIPDEPMGWIPCSERLPEIGQRVLLWVYGKVHIGERMGHKLFEKYDVFDLKNGTFESTKRIEAWMPLPEAYKPEKGAQYGNGD